MPLSFWKRPLTSHRRSIRAAWGCALFLLLPAALSATSATSATSSMATGEEQAESQGVLPVTRDQFAEILERHRGEVVLVNFWATWCIPCIQELPEIDELQVRYREKGLIVLCVSFDELENREDKVQPFFAEKAPHLVSYIQAEEDPFTFATALLPDWVGSLPMSFIFDRSGKLRKAVTGRLTFRSFEDAILPLLAEERAK